MLPDNPGVLAYRYLFAQLVSRELRRKYKGSRLGVLWYLVNPLVLLGAYTLMFGYVLKVQSFPDYPIFLMVGIVVWTFFQQSLRGGGGVADRSGRAGSQGALPARGDPGLDRHRAADHVRGDPRAVRAARDRAAGELQPGAAAAAR